MNVHRPPMTKEVMMAEQKEEVGEAQLSEREALDDPAAHLPGGAPEGLKEAARGHAGEVDGAEESEALDFLLGRTRPLLYEIPTRFDTDKGERRLIFVVQQMDGERILEIEKENRKGDGPFAELDDIACNAQMVSEACVAIVDAKTGAEVAPTDDRFIGGAPGGAAMAVKVRFKYQSGILDGVTGQIRSVSGYNPNRVEAATRSVRDAVGGS
jgi:hypothetical protein